MLIVALWLSLLACALVGGSRERVGLDIDPSSLKHKVLCGYQGWFRCAGDPAGEGWKHWSRNAKSITPGTVTFEMWPELAEFDEEEKYPAPGFVYPDGKHAHLFSSVHPKTVERHFEWMSQYGLDGVFVQRFLVELEGGSSDRVLKNVRAAAAKTGRVYGVCYDLTGASEVRLFDQLTSDWKRLVDDEKVTRDKRYLHHGGKPVVFVWGFYSDRFSPALAHRVIDFFKVNQAYGATLIGGCQWNWRNETDPEWASTSLLSIPVSAGRTSKARALQPLPSPVPAANFFGANLTRRQIWVST